MATFVWFVTSDPPPEPIEIDVEHSPIEYIDMVAHALSRLVQQFRGDL